MFPPQPITITYCKENLKRLAREPQSKKVQQEQAYWINKQDELIQSL